MIQKSYRSAKTGKFVTKKFASKHKATTYLDKIKKKDEFKIKKSKVKYGNYPEDEFNEW